MLLLIAYTLCGFVCHDLSRSWTRKGKRIALLLFPLHALFLLGMRTGVIPYILSIPEEFLDFVIEDIKRLFRFFRQ